MIKGKIKLNKKIFTISILLFLIVIIVLLVLFNKKSSKNLINIENIENARAMNYAKFVDGDENIENTDNVKFSAFFLRDLDGDGYAEKLKGTCKEVGNQDKLYMEVNVQTEGYLKDAKIEIVGKNFYFQAALPKDNYLKDSYIGNNVKNIEFNQLNSGTQKLIIGNVKSGDYTWSSYKKSAIGDNINNLSRQDNKVILTGIYVSEDGTETAIRKEINLETDWYGTTYAEISSLNQMYHDLDDSIDYENEKINLKFIINTREKNEKLNISKNYVEGFIPEFEGYAPIEVKTNTNDVDFTYDEQTRQFILERKASINENGDILSKVSNINEYEIEVTYPIQAYEKIGIETVELRIPIKSYYEGYNNTNEEFINPYKSNIASTTIIANYEKESGQTIGIDTKIGKYISSPYGRYVVSKKKPLKIYNGLSDSEVNDTYFVTWNLRTGNNQEISKIVLKETKDSEVQKNDEFIKKDSSSESMENITKNIGIYFSNAISLLNDDGYINVYNDETDELLVTFDNSNLSKYSNNNPYRYNIPVKHIRIEISSVKSSESLYIYNLKELDDEFITNNYTKEEFDNFEYIKTNLVTYVNDKLLDVDVAQAKYENPLSIANIRINENVLSTQITKENAKLTIHTDCNESYNEEKWKNGLFLIKFPKEIINVDINSVESNTDNVKLDSYELIEDNGYKYIKIFTSNEKPEEYNIYLDLNISPDPRIETSSQEIELYAYNENASSYYYGSKDIYDVNNNLDTNEYINKTSTTIDLVAPNSLLTNQIASNFDDSGKIIVSPQIAEIKPNISEEEKTADIGIQLKNNYTGTISEILILGKIPFEGNTYAISGSNIGSTFTTNITNEGIKIPEKLTDIATVYYSEKENPSKDLTDINNGWKTSNEVSNWENIKTYIIDLNNYVMEQDEELIFNYTIKIPNNLEYNKVSYSHHGIYFSLDTEEGKYKTQTESGRIGFRVAEKYNLELKKYQVGKDKVVSGATYKVIGEDDEESRTATTNENGIIEIKNLSVDKIYKLKEIKSPEEYELNDNEIRFIGHLVQNNFVLEKLDGNLKGEIEYPDQQIYKAKIEVEDEVKAKIKITKKKKDSDIKLENIKYKITGKGLPQDGKILTTNINGETVLSGLYLNEEYILEETKSEGYYINEKIKLKILSNNGIFTEKIEEGNPKQSSITINNEIPTLNLVLENEIIPTYNLEITKIRKNTNIDLSNSIGNNENVEYLSDAKFELYKNNKLIGKYTTNSNGKININDLYQYVDEKDFDATYILKEVSAPEGYTKVKDIIFKVEEINGKLEFEPEGEIKKNYTSDENTVKLIIEDSPKFKLIKKDGETDEVISNVKFAIYNIDNGEKPAQNSKGEIIGKKENVNGKDYYVIITDENGEITADLPEGLYKAIEVQAPEKYDIMGSTYYFGIGTNSLGKDSFEVDWVKETGINNYYNGSSKMKIIGTTDNGIVAISSLQNNSVELDNNINLNLYGYNDSLIIKYDENRNIEWVKNAGGNSGSTTFTDVKQTQDGGYIVLGYSYSEKIEFGNGIEINKGSSNSSILVKYSNNGEIEWAKKIEGESYSTLKSVEQMNDGGYLIGTEFSGDSIELGNEITLTNKGKRSIMLNRFDENGEIEWATLIGGENYTRFSSLIKTRDGGYLVSGISNSNKIEFSSEIKWEKQTNYDGILIKYNSNNEVEWTKNIGPNSSYESYVLEQIDDGGYVVGGILNNGTVNFGNEIILTNENYTPKGILIKYSEDGNTEWAKLLSGVNYGKITDIKKTNEEGFLVAGNFDGQYIDLGNGIIAKNHIKNSTKDGFVFKFDKSGNAEWAKTVGGDYDDCINSIISISDEEFIIGLENGSSKINLNDSIKLKSGESTIIKYKMVQSPYITIDNAQTIKNETSYINQKSISTSDGGYLISGTISGTIKVSEEENFEASGMTLLKYDENNKFEWGKIVTNAGFYIKGIIQTHDDGYLILGFATGQNVVLEDNTIMSGNNYSGNNYILIKYDKTGNLAWKKIIKTENQSIYGSSITQLENGEYIVGGYFSGDSLQLENGLILNNRGNNNVFFIKYSENGQIIQAKSVGGDSYDSIDLVEKTNDGGFVTICCFRSNSIKISNDLTYNKQSYYGMVAIKYDDNLNVEWYKEIFDKPIHANVFKQVSDGGYIYGNYSSFDFYLENGERVCSNGEYDILLIKYDENFNIEWDKVIGGCNEENLYSIEQTLDGGYVIGGSFCSNIIEFENGSVLKNKTTYCSESNGLILKYKSDGNLEWAQSIGGASGYKDTIEYVNQKEDGSYFSIGTFMSDFIELDNGVTLNKSGNTDLMILDFHPNMVVSDMQELVAKNNRKQFKITTDINEIDGIKGGTISGEDESSYEKVKYGDSSIKEIKIIPDENYQIIKITINGEECRFETLEDGSYIMPQISNITENKNIVVTFSLKDNKITLNKVDDQTGETLQGAKFKIDQIDEREIPQNIIGELVDNGIYNFIENEGKFESTNQGEENTSSNSYIPIDLRECTGKYDIIVNAEISSEEYCDCGIVDITETTAPIEYGSIYIYGTQNAKDYIKTIEGGKMYYLHFTYRKNESEDYGDDKFTINSVKLELNGSHLYHTEVETNSDGKGITQIPFGRYLLTETKAPEGYELKDTPIEINFAQNSNHEFTIENTKKSRVVVHHYQKNTNRKLAKDEIFDGKVNEYYTTSPNLDIDKFELEKDENGKYILPDNATGTYGQEEQQVNYFYVENKVPLIVHHYIEDTEINVPIKNDLNGVEERFEGVIGEMYTTKPLSNDILDDEYEISKIPQNSNGIYEEYENHVIYYYKKVERNFILSKFEEDGITPLPGAKFKIEEIGNSENSNEYTTDSNGKISIKLSYGNYEVTETDAPEGFEKIDNMNINISVTRNAEQNIELSLTNLRKRGKVIVHHYLEGTENKVLLQDGSELEDEEKIGILGETFATRQNENIPEYYEYVSSSGNTSGEYSETIQEVIYYYKLKEYPYTIEYYYDNIKDEDKTEDGVETYGSIIEEYPDKNLNGYKLQKIEHLPLTISQNEDNNVIKVYYEDVRTTATVNYIDRKNNTIIETTTKNGVVGEIFTTEAKDFDGYILIEEPDEKIVTMQKNEIIIDYYYAHISSGVIEKHIDIVTEEILDNKVYEGKEGDSYKTSSKEFEGYDLVEDNIPDNAEGTMTIEPIEVKYYYIRKASVKVQYIDFTTNEIIPDIDEENGEIRDSTEIILGHIGDTYSTNEKYFENYVLKEDLRPQNAEGVMTAIIDDNEKICTEILVNYYYVQVSGGVLEQHIDIKDNEILEENRYIGNEGDYYKTSSKEFEGYDLVRENLPQNAEGIMTVEEIIVKYYYKKQSNNNTVNNTTNSSNTTNVVNNTTNTSNIANTINNTTNTSNTVNKVINTVNNSNIVKNTTNTDNKVNNITNISNKTNTVNNIINNSNIEETIRNSSIINETKQVVDNKENEKIIIGNNENQENTKNSNNNSNNIKETSKSESINPKTGDTIILKIIICEIVIIFNIIVEIFIRKKKKFYK